MSIADVLSGAAKYHVECGDALATLRTLPDGCASCCVTSPPYYALRDYGTGTWEGGDPACGHKAPLTGGKQKGPGLNGSSNREGYSADGQFRTACARCGARRVDAQLGLEDTPAAYVARMVAVFEEVRRVLHPSGVCFVNMGDSYAGGSGGRGDSGREICGVATHKNKHDGVRIPIPSGNCKPKNLLGIPWQLAFALRDAGWYLRSAMPWIKRSAMPESTTDRPSSALEYVFMLSKRGKYFADMEAVRRPEAPEMAGRYAAGYKEWGKGQFLGSPVEKRGPKTITAEQCEGRTGRNLRNADFWFSSVSEPWGLVGVGDELVGLDVTSEALKIAHFAAFPPKLVEPLVKMGSSEKGVCPQCGEPWRRVVKRTKDNRLPYKTIGTGNKAAAVGRSEGSTRNAVHKVLREDGRGGDLATTRTETTGWRSGCGCGLDPIPSLILDPFSGVGTTGLVSLRLGRRYLGIELSEKYVALGNERIRNDAPMFNAPPPAPAPARGLFDEEQ